MKASNVTDEMRRCMSPQDQERYGSPLLAVLANASKLGIRTKPEKEEHKVIVAWLELHGYPYGHSRTDKATTEQLGYPDFCVYEKFNPELSRSVVTRCLLIEIKIGANRQSTAQLLWASICGGIVHVLSSAEEAIALIKRELGE